MTYRSSRAYVNVGANNNSNGDNSNNSRIYDSPATLMRKVLGVTACRSSRIYIGANNNNKNSNNNNPSQRLRWLDTRKIQG